MVGVSILPPYPLKTTRGLFTPGPPENEIPSFISYMAKRINVIVADFHESPDYAVNS